MTVSIFANPGQQVNLAIQVLDNQGSLSDGYQSPTVDFVINPDGYSMEGYPALMEQISTGVYRYLFEVPSGITALGSYLISCSWPHPDTNIFQNTLFTLNVAMPFGLINIIPR